MYNSISITTIVQNDIPSILKINNENLLANKKHLTKDAIENTGFLITPYTEATARSYLNKKECHNLIAKLHNQALAYVFSHNMAEDHQLMDQVTNIPTWNTILKTHKTLYIAQIAKVTDIKGIGTKLINEVINYAIYNEYHYIASLIVQEPICNKPSIKFHEKFEFRCVAKLPHGDKQAGLYVKKLI